MTRKQAITKAIEVLSSTSEHQDIVKVLQSILDDLPLNHWSDDAIRDAIDQFTLDHGRAPRIKDLPVCSKIPQTRRVPSRPSILRFPSFSRDDLAKPSDSSRPPSTT